MKLPIRLTPEQQKHLHDLRVWQKYSAKTKHMLGAPNPPEFDAHNRIVWAEAQAEMNAFVPSASAGAEIKQPKGD